MTPLLLALGMKKLVLIAGSLLVVSNGWAEDEFPIELTRYYTGCNYSILF